jgi:Nucleotidyl transferase AbiEii toxin, Type IV TA system
MSPTRNIGASVRARLLEQARAQRADFQVLLTRYVLERLLYRLSVSEHRDRFILKGAMLLATWVETPFRATRDVDLLGQGPSDVTSVAETFRAICAQTVPDDGVEFDASGLEAAPIREELKYGGVRVRTTALIDRARIAVQIDVGFGDAITPAPGGDRLSGAAGCTRSAAEGLPNANGSGREVRGAGRARDREQSNEGLL